VSIENSSRHEHGQPLSVRIITRAEHDVWIASRASVSFLQTPQWADVKLEWRAESVGWFNQSDALVGAGLILYRNAPIIKRSLAYLPEGPDIDWSADSLSDWLQPLIAHVSRAGAFTLKIGVPVVARSWSQDTIKNAVGPNQKLRNIEADFTNPQLKQIESALQKLNFKICLILFNRLTYPPRVSMAERALA
jgi:hypothetical protein